LQTHYVDVDLSFGVCLYRMYLFICSPCCNIFSSLTAL